MGGIRYWTDAPPMRRLCAAYAAVRRHMCGCLGGTCAGNKLIGNSKKHFLYFFYFFHTHSCAYQKKLVILQAISNR